MSEIPLAIPNAFGMSGDMETKHTPGPWRQEGTSIVTDEVCIAVIEEDGGYEAPPEQRRANTLLLVAAPELLEALKEMLETPFRNTSEQAATFGKARAIVAKAEGRA